MNKKRIASLVLSVALIATAFTACGSSDDKSSDTSTTASSSASSSAAASPADLKGEITFVNHRTDMMDANYPNNWETYEKKFNEKYPNIKVNFEAMKDYEGEIAIRMNSNNYGDVLMLPSKMKDSDLASYFIPLGKKSELEKKYDFVQDRYVGDDTYGIPTAGTCSGMVYNKKIFADAGITTLPKTEEEFLNDLQIIKDKSNGEVIPLYTNYKDNWPLVQWESYRVNVSGDPNFVNQLLPHMDDPFSQGKPHYIVYKYMFDVVQKKLVEKDPMTTNWENSKQMMADGKIAVMALGSWAVGQIKAKSKTPDDIAYMPFPYSQDGKMYSSAAGDYKICINKNSKNIDAAKAWLWWFVDESNFAVTEQMLPVQKGAKYPDTLKDFQDMGVQMIVDNGPKEGENGWLDAIDKESEVGLWAENFKKDIVETALGNKKGTYDDIMNGLNKKWADTRKKLIDEGKIGK
jgi:raffinose/stachyose/melibiose transport system substrate-binding protein